MVEVLHELAVDSESDDEPSSFGSSDFGWLMAYYVVCIHTKFWKRSVDKYKSYGTLSKTTHFLSVFCKADAVQQCTEAKAGMVQDGLKETLLPCALCCLKKHESERISANTNQELEGVNHIKSQIP